GRVGTRELLVVCGVGLGLGRCIGSRLSGSWWHSSGMSNLFRPHSYGDAIAEVYDAWSGGEPDSVVAVVDFLADLAGPGGSALELGVGTGRVALPLAARGIRVSGIEASEQMVAELRAKPGGAELPVV